MGSSLFISAERLRSALSEIASAKTELGAASALASAASLVQAAVAAGQPSDAFLDALSGVEGFKESTYLSSVMDRAVSFHLQEDGSTLGFWLMPVVIGDHPQAKGATLNLRVDSLQLLRASADLAKQMGLLGVEDGWVTALPRLVAHTAAMNADLSAIIGFPQEVRNWMQGRLKSVNFKVDSSQDSAHGLYFLPLVTKHPEGAAINPPEIDANVAARVEQWVRSSLRGESVVTCPAAPLPFAAAIESGEDFARRAAYSAVVESAVADMGVAPSGLSVVVAGYHTHTADGSKYEYLGLTVLSHMTGAVLNTAAIPVPDATADYMEEAKHIIKAMGVPKVHVIQGNINTTTCHHCGELQFALPTSTRYYVSPTTHASIH